LVPALLLSLLAGYLAVMMVQGRFAVTDEMFFKAAGAQWAETGQFAAPELTGLFGATPPVEKIFAVYPPIYPFLFGLWVRLIGFSWRSCVLYDATIHVLLTLSVLLYAIQLDRRFNGLLGILLVAIMLPLGGAGRPDELAMTFGTLGTCSMALRRRGAFAAILCGVAVGLTAGTSLGAGAVFGLIAASRTLCEQEPWRPPVVRCALLFGVSVTTMCFVWLPIVASEPTALWQFVTHVRRIRQQLSAPLGQLLGQVWQYGHFVVIVALVTAAIGITAFGLTNEKWTRREWCRLWLGPLLGLAFVLTEVTNKWGYPWFVEPALIVASTISLLRLWPARPVFAVLGGIILVGAVISGSLPFVKERLEFLELGQDQSYAVNGTRLRSLIPAGSAVFANPDAWWMLRGHCRVYSTWCGRDLNSVQFIVLSGNGSGVPGKPLEDISKDEVQAKFAIVYDNLPRNPVYLSRFRVTNSAYGFGQMVLENVSKGIKMEQKPPL